MQVKYVIVELALNFLRIFFSNVLFLAFIYFKNTVLATRFSTSLISIL
jgi:hypothetical protein